MSRIVNVYIRFMPWYNAAGGRLARANKPASTRQLSAIVTVNCIKWIRIRSYESEQQKSNHIYRHNLLFFDWLLCGNYFFALSNCIIRVITYCIYVSSFNIRLMIVICFVYGWLNITCDCSWMLLMSQRCQRCLL